MNKPSSFDSPDFIKYGTHKGKQIYLHKPTGVQFTDNGAMPGRRIKPEQVGAAVSLFYSGLSINQISHNQVPIFDTTPPSKATVYEWVTDYTKLALKEHKGFKAHTSVLGSVMNRYSASAEKRRGCGRLWMQTPATS